MYVILRSCISSQKKQLLQRFIPFKDVTGYTYNTNNIKKFVSILHVKHFSTTNNEQLERQYIYKGSLTNKIIAIKAVSFLSSLLVLACQPVIISRAIQVDNMASLAMLFGITSIFTVINPILICLLTKKYITSLYYYPKQKVYLAEAFGFFFNKKKFMFGTEEVHIPDICGPFTSCIIKGKPVFIAKPDFIDIRHYFIIMKYNNPTDFELAKSIHEVQRVCPVPLPQKHVKQLQSKI